MNLALINLIMKYLVVALLLVTSAQAQYTNFVWSSATTSNVLYTNRVAMTNMITALNTSAASNMNFVVSNTVWSITNAQGITTNLPFLTGTGITNYLRITNGIVKTNTITATP